MSVNISSYDHYQPEDTDTTEFLSLAFTRIVKALHRKKEIDGQQYMILSTHSTDTLDELDHGYREIGKMIKENETQEILKRIEAGEMYLERTDLTPEQRAKAEATYYALVKSLAD